MGRVAAVVVSLGLSWACDEDESPEGTVTTEQCEAQGGTVVADIGDGAIHDPDYRCEETGEPPIASVVTESGEPLGIEGAVCC